MCMCWGWWGWKGVEASHTMTILALFSKDKAWKRSFEIQMTCWRRKGLCILTSCPRGYWIHKIPATAFSIILFLNGRSWGNFITWIYISEFSSIIKVYPLGEEIKRPQLLECSVWKPLAWKTISETTNFYILFFIQRLLDLCYRKFGKPFHSFRSYAI